MKFFEFILLLAGDVTLTPDLANQLFDAGCDDGTPMAQGRTVEIHFTREAPSLEIAIQSAVKDVTSAGLSVARAEIPTDLISAFH